jgi:proteasome lid subunit RPN8/RPN11
VRVKNRHDTPNDCTQLISTNGRKAERIWHPDTPLFESTTSQLLEIADLYSHERCGFLDSEQNIYQITNVHKHPRMNFFMEEREVEDVVTEIYQIKQDSILGIFHTHPNGFPWPSPRDIVGWPNPKLGWRYFLVTPSDVSEWELV